VEAFPGAETIGDSVLEVDIPEAVAVTTKKITTAIKTKISKEKQ
jgi:hypothetical protein